MKPAVAPGSSTRLGSGLAHAGRDGRNEELSHWCRAPTEGVGADGATFGDDPVVQTVALIFLLSPGLRHLQTAKRDGGVWGVREGGRAVWEAFFWVCPRVSRRHARLWQDAGVRSVPWSLGGHKGARCQKKKQSDAGTAHFASLRAPYALVRRQTTNASKGSDRLTVTQHVLKGRAAGLTGKGFKRGFKNPVFLTIYPSTT